MKNLKPVCFSRSLCNYLAILAIVILSGCVVGLYIPTQKDALIQNIPLETLTSGRNLYVKNCGSCHNLYIPSRYTKSEWTKLVDKMKVRSKIDNKQVILINQYLGLSAKKE